MYSGLNNHGYESIILQQVLLSAANSATSGSNKSRDSGRTELPHLKICTRKLFLTPNKTKPLYCSVKVN